MSGINTERNNFGQYIALINVEVIKLGNNTFRSHYLSSRPYLKDEGSFKPFNKEVFKYLNIKYRREILSIGFCESLDKLFEDAIESINLKCGKKIGDIDNISAIFEATIEDNIPCILTKTKIGPRTYLNAYVSHNSITEQDIFKLKL